MSQLLAYYPHLSLTREAAVTNEALLHLATQSAQQVPITAYRTDVSPITSPVPAKLSYQILHSSYVGYPTQSPQHTEAIFPTKVHCLNIHYFRTVGFTQEGGGRLQILHNLSLEIL